jgi:SAM-dependent methyltransferase
VVGEQRSAGLASLPVQLMWRVDFPVVQTCCQTARASRIPSPLGGPDHEDARVNNPDRRWLVGFDPEHFAKRTQGRPAQDSVQIFREAFQSNLWTGESRSGPGSTPLQTAAIAAAIPSLCDRLEVRRFLDIPCGDFSWMATIPLHGISYTGADLLPEIVEENRRRHSAADRTFVQLDVTRSPLPASDLLLCRDCLVHLSNADALAALKNIAESASRWLLTTTFPLEPVNVDIVTGDWRPIDLTKAPFDLPEPLELIDERCTEQGGAFSDKSLGLWPVSSLRGRFRPSRASVS